METACIGKTEYQNAIKSYKERDEATNVVLYDLCRRWPNHDDIGEINAKLFIIGRTYATGIERGIESPGGQGGSMYRLSTHVLKNRVKLDAILKRLNLVQEPLNARKLLVIVDAHRKLMNLIRPILRKSKSKQDSLDPRSFVSKYLHFHCPAVPIFDNNAANCLRRLVPWRDVDPLEDAPSGADHSYTRYVTRFLKLYQEAMEAGLNPTVKHLDAYLIDVERSRKTKGASA